MADAIASVGRLAHDFENALLENIGAGMQIDVRLDVHLARHLDGCTARSSSTRIRSVISSCRIADSLHSTFSATNISFSRLFGWAYAVLELRN